MPLRFIDRTFAVLQSCLTEVVGKDGNFLLFASSIYACFEVAFADHYLFKVPLRLIYTLSRDII